MRKETKGCRLLGGGESQQRGDEQSSLAKILPWCTHGQPGTGLEIDEENAVTVP